MVSTPAEQRGAASVVVAESRPELARLLWLSVAAALATMALKTLAWQLTGSVGFLSDAAESVVNLVAAVVAVAMLRWAAHPADEVHMYGHDKAEYFSAGVEGALILAAAGAIVWTAVGRLLHPAGLDHVAVGIAVSVAASAINLAVATILVRAGRRHGSITLEADGRHLLTDVLTSAGVVAGVVAVSTTGVERLDPVIALAVAVSIVLTGVTLIRRSTGGLMDRALPDEQRSRIDAVLARVRGDGIDFQAVRTRQAGRHAFVSMDVLVPGAWTVQEGHDLLLRIEREIGEAVPRATVLTHLEPIEDPAAREADGASGLG